jgi:hypothetical protein
MDVSKGLIDQFALLWSIKLSVAQRIEVEIYPIDKLFNL